jgi:phosphohistidine phosphatase
VVSDAVRTRQTWELLKLDATVRFERDLYLADPRVMFETLQACDPASVLIIGHNPGIAEFSRNMLADVPAHNRFDDYPTGATLIADFAIDSWSEVSQETGRAVDFIVPRDLIAS